jgi:hypothetical protein
MWVGMHVFRGMIENAEKKGVLRRVFAQRIVDVEVEGEEGARWAFVKLET